MIDRKLLAEIGKTMVHTIDTKKYKLYAGSPTEILKLLKHRSVVLRTDDYWIVFFPRSKQSVYVDVKDASYYLRDEGFLIDSKHAKLETANCFVTGCDNAVEEYCKTNEVS